MRWPRMVAMTVARQPRARRRSVGRGTGTRRWRLGMGAHMVVKLVRSGTPCNAAVAVANVIRALDQASKPNPTATSIFDLSAATQYAAPVDPTHHQEAAHVTCLSDRRRRLCYSHV